METPGLKIYISSLVKEGHRWQYTDLVGRTDKPRFYFSRVQWFIILLIAISSPMILSKGLNKDFVQYSIAALSIFIGLFLSLVLTTFDKFKQLKLPVMPTAEDKRYFATRRMFFKQFTALTTYAILISLLCIVLLGSVALTETLTSDSIFRHARVAFSRQSFLLFLRLFAVSIFNMTLMYFLIDFLILVLYALGSIHTFMLHEYNKDDDRL